jgi:hypothetical protein
MRARDGGLWAERRLAEKPRHPSEKRLTEKPRHLSERRLAEKSRHLKEAGKLWNSGVPGVVNKPSRPCLETLGFSSGKP